MAESNTKPAREKQGACVSLSISRLNIHQPRHKWGFCCLLNSSKAETAYCSWHHQNKQGILTASNQRLMLRRLSMGLLASAISLAALPAIAQEDGSADDLGVMSISLKDVVKPTSMQHFQYNFGHH